MVLYTEYCDLGFCMVSEELYGRFSALAEAAVFRLTSGRATRESLDMAKKLAFCEVVDIFYSDYDRSSKLSSFSNDGYSEHYSQTSASALERAEYIIGLCFGKDEVCRGV